MTDAPKKIETLTAEQEALLPVWRAKYMKVGWNTDPSDRPRAEKGMRALYRRMKMEHADAPDLFIWVDSPLAAVELIRKLNGSTVSLTGTDGQLDAYWLAFYTYAEEIGADIKEEDRTQLHEWEDVIVSTGPCYPFEGHCIMTERPKVATFDDNELLHGENGPALLYRDGFAVYAINGIRTTKQVVEEPWTLTLEQIEQESNSDQQTIMQARWCYQEKDSAGDHVGSGGGRWLEESGAKIIHEDTFVSDTTTYGDDKAAKKAAAKIIKAGGISKVLADGLTVETHIPRALLEDKLGRKFIMSGDGSTDRIYYIQVNRDAKTCPEAQALLEGIPEADLVGRG